MQPPFFPTYFEWSRARNCSEFTPTHKKEETEVKKKFKKKAKNNYHHHAVPTYRMIPYCVSPPIHTCNGKSRRKNRGTFGACQTVMMPVGYPRSRVQASKSERKKRQARSSQATPPTFHSFLPWKCAKHNYSSHSAQPSPTTHTRKRKKLRYKPERK